VNIFDEALKSLQEAIDYEKGDTSKGREVTRELTRAVSEEYALEDMRIAQ
jgi:hypothetical protein